MSKPLSSSEKLIASLLLEKAADQFGSHCCNGFSLEVIPLEERHSLVEAMCAENGTPEYYEEDYKNYEEYLTHGVPDWWLMDYLSRRLKESIEE